MNEENFVKVKPMKQRKAEENAEFTKAVNVIIRTIEKHIDLSPNREIWLFKRDDIEKLIYKYCVTLEECLDEIIKRYKEAEYDAYIQSRSESIPRSKYCEAVSYLVIKDTKSKINIYGEPVVRIFEGDIWIYHI